MLTPDMQLLIKVARRNYLMRSSPTIEAIEDDASYTGEYLSGQPLATALQELYRFRIGPINERRREALLLVGKGENNDAANLELDLLDAITTPLIEACSADEGYVIPFCYRAVFRTGVQLPTDIWWTRYFGDVIERVVPDRADSLHWLPNIVNKSLYLFMADNTEPFEFPLHGEDLLRFRREIHNLTGALLHQLWL